MSICIHLDNLSIKDEEKIVRDVRVKKIEKSYNPKTGFKVKETFINAFLQNNLLKNYCVPFYWALNNIEESSRRKRSEFSSISVPFNSNLRSIQLEIKDETIKRLNKHGCLLISLYPGAGKTCLSIYLASKVIKLKTLIICHRIVLIEQWKDSIKRFTSNDTSIEIIKPNKKYNENADFFIVNAQNIKKLGRDVFLNIGFVIIDEIHSIMAESLSESLFYVSPRYLLGLSATPTRPDGMDALLDFYFGKDNCIKRELYHKHIVYKVDTGIEFEEESSNWNSLITSQCLHKERNKLIVNIVLKFKNRNFLILCKRVQQASFIYEKLIEEKENVSLMIENINKFDSSSRIIVASLQKCGVGFSHDLLDALIIASDMEEYFIQYLARVMRTEEVEPIVFDLVDNHKGLKKHFTQRKKIYLKSGGIIENYKIDYSI
jgi:superfamily II DNA or RNA helicase